MGKTLALITLGQTPRQDLVDEFAPLLGFDVDVLQAGVLDGLAEAEIRQLAPKDPDDTAVTLRTDGTPVHLDARSIAPRLAERVAYVEVRGADLTVLCSTLDVEPVASRCPVIYPARLLPRTVEALMPSGVVTVVVPLHRQERAARRRWAMLDGRLVVAVHHPYEDDNLNELAGQCRDAGSALVVMDSFAYSAEGCRDVAAATGLPVLSARRLVARIVAELLNHDAY
ncbi:MAG TPA: AroM family protein [Bacillota bacterium]